MRQPHHLQPHRRHFRAEVLQLRGFWMLVDAAVFAVACALLVSMPHTTRPAHALESVALSTALEDVALAASLQPDLVASACESTAGELALREKFKDAVGAFSANAFLVHCQNGKTFSLSDAIIPEYSQISPTAAIFRPASKSIFTNRVIVPKDGRAMLVLFEAQSAGG